MFIGHYGVAMVAKAVSPRTPLSALFVAVQLLDVAFFSFVLVGIERMRIVPHITEYNAYDLYFMPYSHSLVGALLWSLVTCGAWWAWRRSSLEAAIVGAAVLSHFVLDLPMHTPDLPLSFGAASPRIGLGLWNHRWVALALELATFAAGAWFLRRRMPTLGASPATTVFLTLLTVIAIATPFLPAPGGPSEAAAQGLAAYFVLAAGAAFVERRRGSRA